MTELHRVKYLQIALVAVGLVFIFGIYPLSVFWPSGWSWHMGQSMYLEMILGIYATLGVFLLMAARDPLSHRSLILLPCGRAWSMGASWLPSRWSIPSTWDISGAMCRHC